MQQQAGCSALHCSGTATPLATSLEASPAFAELITTAPVITLATLPLVLRGLLAATSQMRSKDSCHYYEVNQGLSHRVGSSH